jgi:hypothetical protein
MKVSRTSREATSARLGKGKRMVLEGNCGNEDIGRIGELE